MSEIILKVEHLKKYYEERQGLFSRKKRINAALDDVSLEIRKGSIMGLAGESGSGKSTAGKTMLNLIKPSGGRVIFEGKQIFDADKGEYLDSGSMTALRQKMQIIFQDPSSSLNPKKNVEQIISVGIIKHRLCSGSQVRERCIEIMEKCGLDKRQMMRYPHEFSGGQRQRIGIARALAVEPELIIADEPVSALDVSIQAQVLNLLHQLQKEFNLTYIFVAHDLSVVEHISDRVGVMYLGNFVEVGDKRKLYSNPLHPYTQALLSAVPVPDPTAKKDRIILEGSIPSALNPPSGCKFHTRCPRCMDICKKKAPERYQVSDDHYVYCHLYDDKIKENKE